MTEQLEWQLDDWIAEKFMGWKRNPNYDVPVWEDAYGEPHYWSPPWVGAVVHEQFRPSSDPTAFALVKREIERRGWNWNCSAVGEKKPVSYRFDIEGPCKNSAGNRHQSFSNLGFSIRGSEELAGCLAVKAAIEGMA